MISALLFAAAAAGPAPAPPGEEALALGRQIAAIRFLATLAPLKTRAEIDEMIADNPGLSAQERSRLREIGAKTADDLLERVIAAEGRAFAANLSLADLRTIAAFAATGAAQRQRAAMVPIVAATAQSLDGLDYGGSVKAAFCTETGKLCAKP